MENVLSFECLRATSPCSAALNDADRSEVLVISEAMEEARRLWLANDSWTRRRRGGVIHGLTRPFFSFFFHFLKFTRLSMLSLPYYPWLYFF